jgi:hypothetical protein
VNESNHIEPSDSESEAEMDDEEVAKEIQKELDFHRKFPNYKIIRDPSLPGVWKNLASGMTRFTDVIKRAVRFLTPVSVASADWIPATGCRR